MPWASRHDYSYTSHMKFILVSFSAKITKFTPENSHGLVEIDIIHNAEWSNTSIRVITSLSCLFVYLTYFIYISRT